MSLRKLKFYMIKHNHNFIVIIVNNTNPNYEIILMIITNKINKNILIINFHRIGTNLQPYCEVSGGIV